MTIPETQEMPMWQIQIMKQRKDVDCYYCDTKLIKTLKYYGKPIQYKLERDSMMFVSGEKLILEFLDRSNVEFERGYLLKLGYECIGKEEGMNVFKKSENESNINEKYNSIYTDKSDKYNIDPPISVPEVPDFSIKCDIFISKTSLYNDSLYRDFQNKLYDCFPNYKENYNEFLKCVKDKGIAHQEMIINKNDIPADKEESDRGIRRTYKYICPENSIIIFNGRDINDAAGSIDIQ